MLIYQESKLVEIYYDCDEFCKSFHYWRHMTGFELPLENTSRMSDSELMTILICYQLSGRKCFKYFYQQDILCTLSKDFPNALSYERFVEVMASVGLLMIAYVNVWKPGELTGYYFIDSTKLPVCHNLRIHSHRVFDGIAQRGKSSTGWFYGLKMHLIVNQHGQIVRALLSSGNRSDMNLEILSKLTQGVTGKMWADRGYASWKAFEQLWEQGLKLIFRFKKNMKNVLMSKSEKLMGRKRALAESVIEVLKHVCDLQHTRHRKPDNAFTHMFAAIAAYAFRERKPAIDHKYCWLALN